MVHEPADRGTPELKLYINDLKIIGIHAVETVETSGHFKSKMGAKKSGTVGDLLVQEMTDNQINIIVKYSVLS